MIQTDLFPDLHIVSTNLLEGSIEVVLHASHVWRVCPACGHKSCKVHSVYQRSPRDLASLDRTVCLRLQVRRFFCFNTSCTRTTFAETFPELVGRHAQPTERLQYSQAQVGVALGGQAGSRLLTPLHLPASPSTVLRTINRVTLPKHDPIRVLGVDDFALRKGKRYGTVLVDLERRCIVDVLPDRTTATLSEWLKQRPSIEMVSRDGSLEYAQAITQGAPQAQQVYDRWHLLKNLGEYLHMWLTRHRNHLVEPNTPEGAATPRAALAIPEGTDRHLRQLLQREMNRSSRLEKYHRVKALHQEGKTYEQISSQSGVSFKTVRRWLKRDGFPEYKTRRHVIEPFLPYLKTRLSQGPTTRRQLWIELQTQGFGGCLETVNSAIALIGCGFDEAAFNPSRVLPPAYHHYSVYDAMKLFTCPTLQRSSEDQARFERFCQDVPLAKRIHAWVEDMRHILCRHPLDRPATQILESLMQEAADL